MAQKQYISVILPLRLEWIPCYSADMEVRQGDRVRVIFANKEYVGVTYRTGIVPDVSPEKVRDIICVENDIPSVLPQEMELWMKVAEYYMCTVGEVYKAAYPGMKINMEQARAQAKAKVCQRREKAIELIQNRIAKLQSRLEKKESAAAEAKEGTKSLQSLLSDIIRIKEELAAGNCALEKARESLTAAENGMIIPQNLPIEDNVHLSEAQESAIENIRSSFQAGKPALLHGVTGSGKTEIYIKLAFEAIRNNKNVLYLVPEIALSRQLEERLSVHLGERLLTFHSSESAASRRNSAEIIRNMSGASSNYIALCTRSGVFLPHHNLGLIIVDEEHDSSYKQDSPAPRYNGRDTALMMSKIHTGCNLILGSATPSLESVYNALAGRHTLVTLTEKYHGAGTADIEIIDTKAERRKRGMAGSFSRKLIEHINSTLQSGEQVLILRSRRAWATTLQCDECGEIQKCPHCNVSLSFHKNKGTMLCHYCGYSAPYTGTCQKCNGQLSGLGTGTQKIEEEAASLFPEAVIARLDSDSSESQRSIINDFTDGKTDILIGTQMVGKGFDFSNLGLVAVIAADGMLGIQDFRADEKALHLLEQFRGRCGRREKNGLFVIQTSQPEHPVYRNLCGADNTNLSETLLTERKDFGFPPFSRIIEITIKDKYADRVERMSGWLSERLSKFEMTGPYLPVIDRIADQHLRKIRICLPKDRTLFEKKKMIREIISRFETSYKYDGHIVIDVDPA